MGSQRIGQYWSKYGLHSKTFQKSEPIEVDLIEINTPFLLFYVIICPHTHFNSPPQSLLILQVAFEWHFLFSASASICYSMALVMLQWSRRQTGLQAKQLLLCWQKLHNSRNSIKVIWWRRVFLVQIRDKRSHTRLKVKETSQATHAQKGFKEVKMERNVTSW